MLDRTNRAGRQSRRRGRASRWAIFVLPVLGFYGATANADVLADEGGRSIVVRAEFPIRVGQFSPDGKLIALGTSRGTIELWELADIRRLRGWSAHSGSLQSLAFHPDGKLVASEGRDRMVKLWRVDSGELTWSRADPHGTDPTAEPDAMNTRIAFAEDGQRLAAFGFFWDTTSAKQLERYGPTGRVCIRCGLLACESREGFHVLEMKDMSERLRIKSDAFNRFEISPDGKTLAVGNAFFGAGAFVRNIADDRGASVTQSRHWIYGLSFTPDSKTLAVGGRMPEVYIFDMQTHEVTQRLETPGVENYWVGFSPDGKLLAAVGVDETVRLWSFPDCRPLHKK